MYTGYYIKSLNIDSKNQTAHLVFYFWLRTKVTDKNIDYNELKDIEFINAEINEITIHEERFKNNDYYLTGEVNGEFKFNADYKYYPFDSQRINITIEHVNFEEDELIFLPDNLSYSKSNNDKNLGGISKDLISSDLQIIKTAFSLKSRKYDTNFGDPEILGNVSNYSSLEFSLYTQRNFILFYVIKFLIPLMIILSLAYLVFYIEADQLELASTLTVTSLFILEKKVSSSLHLADFS